MLVADRELRENLRARQNDTHLASGTSVIVPLNDPQNPIRLLPLEQLRLDPMNPRLPAEMQGKSETELVRHIAETFNAIEVSSIDSQVWVFSI